VVKVLKATVLVATVVPPEGANRSRVTVDLGIAAWQISAEDYELVDSAGKLIRCTERPALAGLHGSAW